MKTRFPSSPVQQDNSPFDVTSVHLASRIAIHRGHHPTQFQLHPRHKAKRNPHGPYRRSAGFESIPKERTFNLVPDLEAIPLILALTPGIATTIQIKAASANI